MRTATKAVKAVLQAALGQRFRQGIQYEAQAIRKWELFKHFSRVLIEDSTCQKVDANLHAVFPTTNDGKGSVAAMVRIQTIYELVQNCFLFFKVESYRNNDQSAAENLFSVAQKGDLILRHCLKILFFNFEMSI